VPSYRAVKGTLGVLAAFRTVAGAVPLRRWSSLAKSEVTGSAWWHCAIAQRYENTRSRTKTLEA
jgi:hypothetical protein